MKIAQEDMMQLWETMDHMFAGDPDRAAWAVERMREMMDVSAWEMEADRARKARAKDKEARAVVRRAKNREAVAKRRRIARSLEIA